MDELTRSGWMYIGIVRLIPLFLAVVCCAQEPLSVTVNVSLVTVAFIARDAYGDLATNLGRADVKVLEDGVPQEVRFFSRSADMPLRLALIMDVSGSQAKFNKRHAQDLADFAGSALGPHDQALLVCFANHIHVVSDFGATTDSMIDRLEAFQKSFNRFAELDPDRTREGGTALFDAIYATATGKLSHMPGERKAIIVFSDGQDNSSAHDLADDIDAAQSADSLIYTVRYTELIEGRLTSRDRYGIKEMGRLAKETGGASFDASSDDVAGSLRQVADELRSVYTLGYMSTNPATDGRFRNVEIRVNKPGLTVRAKPGYYAR